jgi:hypothetical protein
MFNPSHRKRHEGQNGQNTKNKHHKPPNFKQHLIDKPRQNFPQHNIQQNQGSTTAPTSKLAVIRPKRNEKKIRPRVNRKMYEKNSASMIGQPISANQESMFLSKTRRKSTDRYLRNIHAMIFDVIRTISYPEISTSEIMSIQSQLNSLPTPHSKMARTKISAKPRRSPRLETKITAPTIPVLSRNQQRSLLLQEIEGLLYEGMLTIENFIDYETTELFNDEFARLRQQRTTNIQQHGATIERILKHAITMSTNLPVCLRQYHVRFLDIQLHLVKLEEKVIRISMDTIKFLLEYVPPAPTGPPPRGIAEIMRSLISDSESDCKSDDPNKMPPDETATNVTDSSSTSSPMYSPTSD